MGISQFSQSVMEWNSVKSSMYSMAKLRERDREVEEFYVHKIKWNETSAYIYNTIHTCMHASCSSPILSLCFHGDRRFDAGSIYATRTSRYVTKFFSQTFPHSSAPDRLP